MKAEPVTFITKEAHLLKVKFTPKHLTLHFMKTEEINTTLIICGTNKI